MHNKNNNNVENNEKRKIVYIMSKIIRFNSDFFSSSSCERVSKIISIDIRKLLHVLVCMCRAVEGKKMMDGKGKLF